jgi:hypothetical protein
MPAMLAFLLAQAVVTLSDQVTEPPPPPPIHTVTSRAARFGSPDATKIVRVAAEIRVGSALLWKGELPVATYVPATFNQSWTEVASVTCPGATARDRIANHRMNLNLRYNSRRDSSSDLFYLTFEWSRPGEGSCPSPGQRTISISQPIEIAQGGAQTVSGDGNLRLTFRRLD